MRLTGNTVPSAFDTCAMRDEPRARRQQGDEGIKQKLALAIDGRHLQGAAGLLAHDLPGDDVGVVLEGGDEDLIAGTEARPARRPARRD